MARKLTLNSKWTLNSGHSIPILGFGTYKMAGPQAKSAIFEALKAGYRHIDTATLYQNEADVGGAIKRGISELGLSRDDLFVTTKLWNADHGNPRKALERSLNRLGMPYVDLYLIHWPMPQSLSTWKTLEKLCSEGMCASIGVSNFTIPDLEALLQISKIPPAVNQVEFSPFLFQKELLDFCKRKNLLLEAYSPLTRGRMLGDAALADVAMRYGKSAAQMMLRWCLQHGALPLPKSSHKERIIENSKLFDFSISKRDMEKLDSLSKGLHTGWNPQDRISKKAIDLFSPLLKR
ncbi:MAG TPA: aldo/keto reductase [Candidatus Norongarragalinales archaeon]|nr:aldo/keto reductase [Candidatus Norongarragalinales archaeon]